MKHAPSCIAEITYFQVGNPEISRLAGGAAISRTPGDMLRDCSSAIAPFYYSVLLSI
jgi:hypothetical protein